MHFKSVRIKIEPRIFRSTIIELLKILLWRLLFFILFFFLVHVNGLSNGNTIVFKYLNPQIMNSYPINLTQDDQVTDFVYVDN
jgi:hypothetical protein